MNGKPQKPIPERKKKWERFIKYRHSKVTMAFFSGNWSKLICARNIIVLNLLHSFHEDRIYTIEATLHCLATWSLKHWPYTSMKRILKKHLVGSHRYQIYTLKYGQRNVATKYSLRIIKSLSNKRKKSWREPGTDKKNTQEQIPHKVGSREVVNE